MNSVRNICGSDLVRGLIWPRRLLGVFVVMDVCADKVLNPGFGSAHCKLHIRCNQVLLISLRAKKLILK